MGLNPMSGNISSWNYSKQDKPDYTCELLGTVVSLQEVQARDWQPNGQPGAPKFWKDKYGNPTKDPVWNVRIGLALPDGSLKTFTFAEAGQAQWEGKKPSVHVDLHKTCKGGRMEEIIGKTFHFLTWPANPTTGAKWGLGNPRTFLIDEVTDVGPFELNVPLPAELTVPQLLANDGASGGQPVPQVPQMPQYPQQMPQYPQYPQQYQNTAPVPMGVGAQMPQYTAPVQPVQMPQYTAPVQQPQYGTTVTMQPQQPAGMDPAIAQAMAMQQNATELYGDIDF